MNYGELKALAKDYLETDEDTFNANIAYFVSNAEEEVYRQVQLPDLKAIATNTTNSNDRYLSTPSDFLSPYTMAVLDADVYHPLINKDLSFMREAFPSTIVTGRPRYYAVYDDANFILGPTPDTEYTMELAYFYEPASLTTLGDSGTTWLSENAENAILFGTLIQGYIYLKGDQDVIAQYQEKFASAVADLKIIAEGRDRKDSYRQSDKRIPV